MLQTKPFKDLAITCHCEGNRKITHIIIDGKDCTKNCREINFSHDTTSGEPKIHLSIVAQIDFYPENEVHLH